jgi:glycosyltransferase involved in cell wall biosynthesis
VWDQDPSLIEHVVVDGGSTDGTPEYLASLRPSFPYKYVSEPDDGIFDAMNKGTITATGELVIYMNGGDCFADRNIARRLLNSWSSECWDWAFGHINFTKDGAFVRAESRAPFNQRRLVRGTTWIPHQSTIMTSTLLAEIGPYDSRFGEAADQELIMRAALRTRPRVFDFPISNFELGGAHSKITMWQRERMWHQMRETHGLYVGGSAYSDWLYTAMMAGYRRGRRWLSRLKRATK